MKILQIKKRYLRISPRKIRLVGRELVKLKVEQAKRKLSLINKRASQILSQLLTEAEQILEDKNLKSEDFIIHAIRVDQGPALKRHLTRSRGRISPLKKYSSHIILELSQQIQKTAKPSK